MVHANHLAIDMFRLSEGSPVIPDVVIGSAEVGLGEELLQVERNLAETIGRYDISRKWFAGRGIRDYCALRQKLGKISRPHGHSRGVGVKDGLIPRSFRKRAV